MDSGDDDVVDDASPAPPPRPPRARAKAGAAGDAERSARAALKLAVRALLEVVESGAKSIEIGVMRRGGKGLAMVSEADVAALVAEVEAEKAAADAAAGPPPA